MKILAMGLIHKNNTDNQPIEYVYRTLIYDYIEGGVANDRAIDMVNLFINGLISEEGAIRRLPIGKYQ